MVAEASGAATARGAVIAMAQRLEDWLEAMWARWAQEEDARALQPLPWWRILLEYL